MRADDPDDEIALCGGRWVPNGRGTVVWRQERQPVPNLDEPELEPEPEKVVLCHYCLAPFERPNANFRYCSDECRSAGRAEQQRAHNRKRGSRATKKCADCGSAIDHKAKRCKPCALSSRLADGRWAA